MSGEATTVTHAPGEIEFGPDGDLFEIDSERRPRARLRQVWEGRHLVRFFADQALGKLYRRTILGRAWLVARPLLGVGIGTLIFGGVIGITSEKVPYFLFYLVGVSAWTLFESGLTWATRSLELNRKLLAKFSFPRLLLPIAYLAPALLEFAVNIGLIVAVVAIYAAQTGKVYAVAGPQLLCAVPAAALVLLFALALGLWTAIFGALARDVRFMLGYALKSWFLLTPVIFRADSVPERWRWLVALNPIAAPIETFTWSIIDVGEPRPMALAVSVAVTTLCLHLGLAFFARAETMTMDDL